MTRPLTAITLCCVLVACSAAPPARQGAWTEELVVERAGGELVLAQLHFATAAPLGTSHASSFPPAILQLVRRHQLERLAVTLTRGRWPLRSPPPPWALLPPPGLEVAVQFGAGVNDTRTALAALANALAGLLAAAVPSLVQHGALAAPAVGWFGGLPVQRQQIYGAAPQEALCSENVAAWLKLLPSRGQAGLAALLHPAAVLATPLHSLQIHVGASQAAVPGGEECPKRQVRLSLGATMLIDGGTRGGLGEGDSVRRVMESVFGRAVPPVCTAAAASSVHLPARTQGGGAWAVQGCTPSAGGWQTCTLGGSASGGGQAARPSCAEGPSRWALAVLTLVAPVSPLVGRLSLVARVSGGGDAKQAQQAKQEEALLHVMQAVPWQLSLRWRTLLLVVDGRAMPLTGAAVAWRALRPAQPRGRAALIELLVRLPAGGSSSDSSGAAAPRNVTVSIEFEKQLRTVHDYPPDASRGVDIPAAMVTLLPPGCSAPDSPPAAVDQWEAPAAPLLKSIACGCGPQQRRGRVHLVQLPIPDASMPFNVVCFTSTALALYFGAAMNALLQAPGEAAAGASGGGRTLRQRVRRLAAVLLLVGALALYLDRDLQRKAGAWVAVWVRSREAAEVEL